MDIGERKGEGMKRRGTALIGILCILMMFAGHWGGRAAGDGPEPTVEVRVKPGDTLWSLAPRHTDDSVDIRELIAISAGSTSWRMP